MDANLQNYINKHVDCSKKQIEKHGYHVLSTCTEWEIGYYGANSLEYKSIRYAIDELKKCGFIVISSINHGVTDYVIKYSIGVNL